MKNVILGINSFSSLGKTILYFYYLVSITKTNVWHFPKDGFVSYMEPEPLKTVKMYKTGNIVIRIMLNINKTVYNLQFSNRHIN